MAPKNEIIDVKQEELFEELHDKFDALLAVLVKKEMISEEEFLNEFNNLSTNFKN